MEVVVYNATHSEPFTASGSTHPGYPVSKQRSLVWRQRAAPLQRTFSISLGFSGEAARARVKEKSVHFFRIVPSVCVLILESARRQLYSSLQVAPSLGKV